MTDFREATSGHVVMTCPFFLDKKMPLMHCTSGVFCCPVGLRQLVSKSDLHRHGREE